MLVERRQCLDAYFARKVGVYLSIIVPSVLLNSVANAAIAKELEVVECVAVEYFTHITTLKFELAVHIDKATECCKFHTRCTGKVVGVDTTHAHYTTNT